MKARNLYWGFAFPDDAIAAYLPQNNTVYVLQFIEDDNAETKRAIEQDLD